MYCIPSKRLACVAALTLGCAVLYFMTMCLTCPPQAFANALAQAQATGAGAASANAIAQVIIDNMINNL